MNLLAFVLPLIDPNDDPGLSFWTKTGIGVGIIILSGILWIVALIAILASSHYTIGGKLLWILAALPYPILGPLFYFLVGRRAKIVKDVPVQTVVVKEK